MSVQSSFDRFVKSMQSFLAEYGFERKGGRVLRKFSAAGDVLIIELQTSSGSDKSQRLFFINVALTLAPQWALNKRRYELPDDALPLSMHGLWLHRIGFDGYDGGDRWLITDDTSAIEVWERVRVRLESSLPELLQLLDRDRLWELAERKELISYGSWQAKAWLLAERGPSAELEAVLLNHRPAGIHTSTLTQGIMDYARMKASAGE